jgi:hypothetical protein
MRQLVRQLVVFVAGLVDMMAAWVLGGTLCMLIVCAAAGWATAQYDDGYQRAKGVT